MYCDFEDRRLYDNCKIDCSCLIFSHILTTTTFCSDYLRIYKYLFILFTLALQIFFACLFVFRKTGTFYSGGFVYFSLDLHFIVVTHRGSNGIPIHFSDTHDSCFIISVIEFTTTRSHPQQLRVLSSSTAKGAVIREKKSLKISKK